MDTANDGVEAVKMVFGGEYDLVLMDVQMPEMDGHEATLRIREEPAFKDLPILAMTEEIRAAIEEEDLELAARLVHTLKGVAGNIGANDLALAAKDLEIGITKDGLEVAPVLIESTRGHLDQIISALSVIEAEAQPQTATGPVDWALVQESQIQLRGLLETSDTAASKVVTRLFGQLADDAFTELLKIIEVSVDSYDFDMALEHLVELEKLVKQQF